MKTLSRIILPAMIFLSSCSMETFFKVGVSLPSGFSHYAKRKYKKVTEPFDVVIVPGIPYQPDKVSNIMNLRLHWAKYLYETGLTRNIIFSGSAVHSPYTEGIVMKIIADSLGIPGNHTFAETMAEHSIENAYYSLRIAKEMGFKRIALATDPFQSRMLQRLIARYCPEIELIPVVYKKIKSTGNELPTIVATEAEVVEFVSLRERETRAQRLRGTRGWRIANEVAMTMAQQSFLQSSYHQNKFDSLTLVRRLE